ncbi:unnamed protein product [Tilletia controversa]|uniref:Uncharacterized protein n=1 Tax=Tilletia controversa TaxID=13291 RepID=A0A8X7MW39_9BASI|nr:hypothetical protein CF328_g2576 [Tilletia controversa]KAE8249420.1 hypothetical protein A4X06_0g3238 [Tilletia controversa]CAD6941850.1 unnamed protein product [Tilletia controversa]
MVYDPDPFSRAAAPPRHNIESDSEDDDLDLDHRTEPQPETRPSIFFKPTTTTAGRRGTSKRPLLIVLPPTLTSGPGASSDAALAHALDAFAQLECVGTFELGGEGAGAQAALGPAGERDGVDVLLLAPDAEGAEHPTASLLAREIVKELMPSRITLLSTYWPPTYIISPDVEPPTSDEPPVRFLSSSPACSAAIVQAAEVYAKQFSASYDVSPAVLPFDVPNALTGVDGALVLQANLLQFPISVLLQPFEMLQGLSPTSEPIFPLSSPASTSTTSPLSAVLQASLGLPRPLSLTISSSSEIQRTGDFVRTTRNRSRRRREVEEQAVRAKLVGRRAEAAESTLYV